MAEEKEKSKVRRILPRTPRGRRGIDASAGFVKEDFLNRLHGPRGVAVYKEMKDNDPIIGGILRTIDLKARGVNWNLKYDLQDMRAQRASEVIKKSMNSLEVPWNFYVSDILSMLTFGWSLLEVTFRPSDGDIVWSELGFRSQDTLFNWEFDEMNNSAIAMNQRLPNSGAQYTIPLNRCLHFKVDSRKGNPEGYSLLRTSYRPWYFKKIIEELEAIGIGRDASGVPVLKILQEGFDPNLEENKEVLAWAEDLVTSLHKDEQAGVVLWPGMELDLLGAPRGSSTTSTNVDEVIRRYNQSIAIGMQAQLVLLSSQTRGGAQSVAEQYGDMFTEAIDSWLKIIAQILDGKNGIKKLLRWNGLEDVEITFAPSKLSSVDKVEFAAWMARLAKAGVIVPDQTLENQIRADNGLPPVDDKTKRFLANTIETLEKSRANGYIEIQGDLIRETDGESINEENNIEGSYAVTTADNKVVEAYYSDSLETAISTAMAKSLDLEQPLLLCKQVGSRKNGKSVYRKVMQIY